MRVRLGSLAAAVALGPLVVPALTASAAAPMCQGEEATIVDTDGGTVEGTEGDDVIVAGRLASVRALGGNDKVCTRGGRVSGGGGHDAVSIHAGRGDDHVKVDSSEDLDIKLGSGDDFVQLGQLGSEAGKGTVAGGSGDDEIDVSTRVALTVDLEDELLQVDRASVYRLVSFKDIHASTLEVTLAGNAQANRIEVENLACSGSVRGGRGDDLIKIGRGSRMATTCAETETPRVLGQRGDDRLLGSERDDILIGGLGRDVAEGDGGRDKCRAEVKMGCER